MSKPQSKKSFAAYVISVFAKIIAVLALAAVLVFANYYLIDPDDPLGGGRDISRQEKATKEK